MTDKKQGKWSTHSPYTSVAGVTFIQKDGDSVAEVYGGDDDGRALATLFSSAPEMLEMLREIFEIIRTQLCERELKYVEQFNLEDWENIRRLIAKAEGSNS